MRLDVLHVKLAFSSLPWTLGLLGATVGRVANHIVLVD